MRLCVSGGRGGGNEGGKACLCFPWVNLGCLRHCLGPVPHYPHSRRISYPLCSAPHPGHRPQSLIPSPPCGFCFLCVRACARVCMHATQVLLGLARPAPQHSRRWVWNVLHHNLGRAGVLLAWANVYIGIYVYHSVRACTRGRYRRSTGAGRGAVRGLAWASVYIRIYGCHAVRVCVRARV